MTVKRSKEERSKRRKMITERGRTNLKNLIFGGNPFHAVHLKLLKPEVFTVMSLGKKCHNH